MTPAESRAWPAAAVFVWTAWVVMLGLSLGLIVRCGSRVPVWDDYDLLPRTIGDEPVTLRWLWSQHNEHRVPLPRLVLLGLDRIVGNDAQAGMVFSALALAAAAASLIVAIRKRRGTSTYTDALLPLVLLGPGHHANLLWSWQVQFTLSTALFAGIMAIVTSVRGDRLGVGRGWAVGLLAAALPLCGANGVALVPALGVWLLIEAGRCVGSGRRRQAFALALAALPSLALTGLYVRGYHAAAQHPAARSLSEVLRALVQFSALAWGPSGERFWWPAGLAILVLLAVSAVMMTRAILIDREQRTTAGGLLAVLVAFGCLALGLAWGRAGAGERAALEARYVTLASPALIVTYLAASTILRRAAGEFATMALFTAVCIVSWPNAEAGWTAGLARAQQFNELAQDIRAGTPPSWIVRKFTPFLHPSQDVLSAWLPVFRAKGIGPFTLLRGEPDYDAVPLPIEPIRIRQMRREGSTFVLTGVDPHLTFAVPGHPQIVGVRLDYDHENAEHAPAHFRIAWRTFTQPDFSGGRTASNWALPTGRIRSATFWLWDVADEIQIQPDTRPGRFRLHALTLLLRPRDARRVRSELESGPGSQSP